MTDAPGPVHAAQIRATHRYAFRSGKWAKLCGTVIDPETGRECYTAEFADGTADFWPVHDPDAGYEFRDEGELTP